MKVDKRLKNKMNIKFYFVMPSMHLLYWNYGSGSINIR